MSDAKLVVIGAGSASFGLATLSDIMNTPALAGSHVTLVDVDSDALEAVAQVARRMNEEAGADLTIEHSTDRTRALPDADFVIISIAVQRNRLWKQDWEIPLRHGVKHVLGENGGPGGLFHCMRNTPIILDICTDIERLCPKALVLNFTNPVTRISMAVDRYTNVKAVGLCHGIGGQLWRFSEILGVPADGLDAVAAGLNHFTWIRELRFKDTGADAYPDLRRRLAHYDPTFQPLSRRLWDIYGYYPSPGDDHVGEYLSWATEYCPAHGYDFAAAEVYKTQMWERIHRIVRGEESVSDLISHGSGERALAVISGIVTDSGHSELAVNVRNEGAISNLPDDAIVEVPAAVSRNGISPIRFGPLPAGIASLCNTQIAVQELAVEAAVKGDRRVALQALLADPVVHSAQAAEAILDELLALQADFLPQFSGRRPVLQ